MAVSLLDGRQLSDEVLQALRLRALKGCELGYTEMEIADLLGVRHETVSRWWTAYVTGGPDALPRDRTGRPVGSGRTLADEPAPHSGPDRPPQPRGIGHPVSVVEPACRARFDPPRVGPHPAGADGRGVPPALGLHGQAAPSPRANKTPRKCGNGWRRSTRPSSSAQTGGS